VNGHFFVLNIVYIKLSETQLEVFFITQIDIRAYTRTIWVQQTPISEDRSDREFSDIPPTQKIKLHRVNAIVVANICIMHVYSIASFSSATIDREITMTMMRARHRVESNYFHVYSGTSDRSLDLAIIGYPRARKASEAVESRLLERNRIADQEESDCRN
jgi:hypothetical protein